MLNKKWKQFENWFNLYCGWFFTNGNKVGVNEKYGDSSHN
jgi:hypothetical protein